MDLSLVPLWITSGAAVAGVVYAISRNGTRGKKQDKELVDSIKAEVSSIKEKLEDPVNGLSAIKESVDAQKLHCKEVSTAMAAQVNTNKEEIAILRKKRR